MVNGRHHCKNNKYYALSMKLHLPTINQFASLLVLNITNAIFQLLVIPILIHNTATEKLGGYFLALSFSVLASIFVNFGTSQTAVVEIRNATTETQRQTILAETLAIRFFPLLLAIVVSCILPFIANHGIYYILVLPMIVAEFINPQFYLIATYKVNRYTVLNLLLRLALLLIIFLLRTNDKIIEISLFIIGMMMLLLNVFYLQSTFLKKGTIQYFPTITRLQQLFKTNILVTGNGLTVHLQQSLFLFALPSFVTPLFLSAYGLIDKLISSFRMLVNAYSSAVMPHAAGTHHAGFAQWKKLKKQQNIILSAFCILAGAIMYLFPEQLLTILFLGKNNNTAFFNEAAHLVQLISPVPLLIALNVLNVAELILEKKFLAYFGAGIFILFISLLSIDALKLGLPASYAGYYPVLIEASCLLLYVFIVQKFRNEQ